MATSVGPMGSQGIDGLHCDLGGGVQPATFPVQNCLHFFPGMGFRPAVWVMQRDQYGDKLIRVVGDDQPFLAKYDGPAQQVVPLDVMAFLPETPIAAVSRAQPSSAGQTGSGGWQFSDVPSYSWPGNSGGSGSGWHGHGKPPSIPDVPPVIPVVGDSSTHHDHGDAPSPVPLSGSGLFLAMAAVLLLGHAGIRKPASRRVGQAGCGACQGRSSASIQVP